MDAHDGVLPACASVVELVMILLSLWGGGAWGSVEQAGGKQSDVGAEAWATGRSTGLQNR